VVLTDRGCKTIRELYNNGNYTENDIYVIVNGNKYKCNNIESCGLLELVKVSFKNGMDIYVDPDQEFIDDKGNTINIQFIKPNNNTIPNRIALNNIDLFVWDNSYGTYTEGYILALVFHNLYNFANFVSIRISKKINDHTEYYPYKLLVEYFIKNNIDYEIKNHMESDDFIIYRFCSPYFKVLLAKLGICENSKNFFERGSYDFTQGYLRSVFDLDAQVIIKDEHSDCIIKLIKKNVEYVKGIQRTLFNLGIPCHVDNDVLIIKSLVNIYKFNFIIGFGVEDKITQITFSKNNSQKNITNHKHHYWSHITDIVQLNRRYESYKIYIDGDIIAVNGILVKA
jgi:hypothetical protein